ncbi:MAG TPA: hypothetical protein VNU20_03260 [Candidatus Sulfotelmatobacter sp.]|nr:hypothetical protein [Candidatus Sulfotelmatobacter sp.]
MGRPVVHFEIGCRNLQKTQEFYSQMFDWKPQPMGPAAMDRGRNRRHRRP